MEDELKELFPQMSVHEAKQLSPSVLAYVGDAVYELYVRSWLVEKHPMKMNQLHRATVSKVNASRQADFLQTLLSGLSAEEMEIVRRGRNCRQGTLPKSTSPLKYRQSTGLEALVGFLFITGQTQRLQQILQRGEL